ncbi:MAG: hypothetical protein ACFB15_28225 [Cyclobacteriaceae bacterium]
MRITKKLLKKHGRGLCTEEERKAVEEWFEMDETLETGLAVFSSEEVNKERIWSKVTQELPSLKSQKPPISKGKRVVPLYKRVIRYAAVACMLIGSFFIGYFSALPSASADTIKKAKQLTDVLHIYGGDSAYGKMDGSRYRVEFNGSLRLYNGAGQPKHIVCGEREFTLKPFQTYYLTGSDQEPILTEESELADSYNAHAELEGGFSALRLDD